MKADGQAAFENEVDVVFLASMLRSDPGKTGERTAGQPVAKVVSSRKIWGALRRFSVDKTSLVPKGEAARAASESLSLPASSGTACTKTLSVITMTVKRKKSPELIL